jgi:hypothetical protein
VQFEDHKRVFGNARNFHGGYETIKGVAFMDKPKRKKKPNKAQREARRAHDAEIYEQGFNHGYQMGLEVAAKASRRNVLNWANRGR